MRYHFALIRMASIENSGSIFPEKWTEPHGQYCAGHFRFNDPQNLICDAQKQRLFSLKKQNLTLTVMGRARLFGSGHFRLCGWAPGRGEVISSPDHPLFQPFDLRGWSLSGSRGKKKNNIHHSMRLYSVPGTMLYILCIIDLILMSALPEKHCYA